MPENGIIIFASGKGRNAENIMWHFKSSGDRRVLALLTNNPDAGVIQKAKQYGGAVKVFNKKRVYETEEVLNFFLQKNPSLILLSRFLLLISGKIIHAFSRRIIKLHPA